MYKPEPAGNLVKPPLIVAPAGSKLVNGLLEKAKVSADAEVVAKIGNPVAIAKASAIVLFFDVNILTPFSS
jgi:hypothetical protein